MARLAPLVALLGVLLASGCLQPHRVHVDADALAQASGWVESREPARGGGLGPRSQLTRYTYDPGTGNPPFPGTLEVVSVRTLARPALEELLAAAEESMAEGAQEHAIVFDDGRTSGGRTIESGVRTSWVLRDGRTTQSGNLFEEEVRVRILVEAGHDGNSDTSFFAVATVQVERTQQCPVLCQPVRSEATWIQVAGDDDGSIDGATSQSGFIDHLVTR